MTATKDREIVISNLASLCVMRLLAQEEGFDPDDMRACIDVLTRRSDEVARFTKNCLPQLMEIDQSGADPAVIERLILEAVASCWTQLQQEVG